MFISDIKVLHNVCNIVCINLRVFCLIVPSISPPNLKQQPQLNCFAAQCTVCYGQQGSDQVGNMVRHFRNIWAFGRFTLSSVKTSAKAMSRNALHAP